MLKLTGNHRKILLACREWCIPDGTDHSHIRGLTDAGYLDQMPMRQFIDPWVTLTAYRTNGEGESAMLEAGFDPADGKALEEKAGT